MDILQILVKAHLEGFGGVGVIEGKSEMYSICLKMINLFCKP
jgi:hypothetical protein